MALKVDLPQVLTAAYVGKRVTQPPAALTQALQKAAKAHAGVDWAALDLPAAVKPEAADTAQAALKAAQKALAQGVAQAADAAEAAAAEADKALAALKKDKSAAKPALAVLQEAAQSARAYAAELRRKAQAAVDSYEQQVAQATQQAAKAAKDAAKEEAKSAAAAGDAPNPLQAKALKLLRAKTLPLLRGLPTRKPEVPPPAFMAAVGPQAGALILNKSVGGTEKNILINVLGGPGGLKFFRGTALWEAKAVTLVSASPVGGAPKKLQAALVKLVKLRFKVRVRKPDGPAEEADGDADPTAIADEAVPALSAEDEAGFAAPDSDDAAAPADTNAQTAQTAMAAKAAKAAKADAADQARVATLNAQLMSLIGAMRKRLGQAKVGADSAAQKALNAIEARRKALQTGAPGPAAEGLSALMEQAKTLGTTLSAMAAPGPGAADALASTAAAGGGGSPAAPNPDAPVQAAPPARQKGTPAAAPGAAAAARASGDPAFDSQRAALQKQHDDLEAGANSFHISGELDQVRERLKAADAAAAKSDFDAAKSELAKGKTSADAAAGFLKSFDDYVLKRDETNALVNAFKASVPEWNDQPARQSVTATLTLASPPTRDYTKAKQQLDQAIAAFTAEFRKGCIDNLKPKIDALAAHADAGSVAADIKRLQDMLKQQEADFAAKAWRKLSLRTFTIANLQLRLQQQLDRGGAYKALRKTAADQLAAAIKLPPLKTLQVELARGLKDADALGSVAEGRWEDGVDALKALQMRIRDARALAVESETWTKERQEAESEVARLKGHVAASHMKAEIQAAAQQIAAACQLVADAGAPGALVPVQGLAGPQDFAQARRTLLRAWADVQTAVAAADAIKGTAQAQADLKARPDAAQAAKTLEALRGQLQIARNAPHADLGVPEWAGAEKSLAEAEQALKGAAPALPKALAALQQAASTLEAGRRRQVEHARVLAMIGVVTQRREALAKGPHGKALQARLAPIQQAEDACMLTLTNGDYQAAMAQVRTGQDRAKAAEADADSLQQIENRRAELTQELAAPELKGVKSAVEKSLKAAAKAAAALDFGGAQTQLMRASGQIGAARIRQSAKAGKGSAAAVEQQARAMLDSAGPKAVDDLIAEMDPKVAPEVLAALAKARFGCEMVPENGPKAQESIQRMCALMAKVPDDVIGNPSLKKITHRNVDTPFYNGAEKGVVMNSRPKKTPKPDFDKKQSKGRLPPREADCEPANDKPEDLFDFNMLHELAHSIDDAKGFMAQRMSGSEFGGWKDHSGNVDEIAQAVAKKFKFEGSPQQHAFVVDVVLGNSPVFPEAPKGQEEAWANAMTDILGWAQTATRANVWDDQSACAALTMDDKRIYHQAYPNAWFSYEAAARARGITSYQFRAPGEWFSELYAAYKVGKLKPSHPAVKWLATLKI